MSMVCTGTFSSMACARPRCQPIRRRSRKRVPAGPRHNRGGVVNARLGFDLLGLGWKSWSHGEHGNQATEGNSHDGFSLKEEPKLSHGKKRKKAVEMR